MTKQQVIKSFCTDFETPRSVIVQLW